MCLRTTISKLCLFLLAILAVPNMSCGDIFTPIGTMYSNAKSHIWFDYEKDGDLDLFMALGYYGGGADKIYLNKDNYFSLSDIPLQSPTLSNICNGGGFSWTASAADSNNNGQMEIFVGNIANGDCSPTDYLYKKNLETNTWQREDVNLSMNTYGSDWGDYNQDSYVDLAAVGYEKLSVLKNVNGDQLSNVSIDSPSGILTSINWVDFNNDNLPDLFVTNRSGVNYLYKNEGGEKFLQITGEISGSAYAYSIDSCWGDYNNDGLIDVFVANRSNTINSYIRQENYLYKNKGNDVFERVNSSPFDGWSYGSTSCSWGDYDNDGYLDLIVANGYGNFLLKNNGDETFTSITGDALTLDSYESESISFADYNNDGFVDVFSGNWDGNRLYLNNGNNNNYLKIKLIGRTSNRGGIGAKIKVGANVDGSFFWQHREVGAQGSGGHGQNDLTETFGLGSSQNIDEIIVQWPSGTVQSLRDISSNQEIVIDESETLVELSSDIVPVGAAPLAVSYICTASDSINQVASYSFDFGDGASVKGLTSGVTQHTYEEVGIFNATCMAFDDNGIGTKSASLVVDVTPAISPIVDHFNVWPTFGEKPLRVTIDCSAHDPDGSIGSGYTYDFGNGETYNSPLGSVSHEYDQAGTFEVSCSVTDDDGLTATSDSIWVEVVDYINKAPTAPIIRFPSNDPQGLSPIAPWEVDIEWEKSTDPDSDSLSYAVLMLQLNESLGMWEPFLSSTASEFETAFPLGKTLIPGSTYVLGIQAIDSNGNTSNYSISYFTVAELSCPPQNSTAENLVFITHGWNSSIDAWPSDMATAIREKVGDNWDVCAFDWSTEASVILSPSPVIAYNRAEAIGERLGYQLLNSNYNHIHLIAHSAGSNLIQTAVETLRGWNADLYNPSIQTTFLDAYYDPNDDPSYGHRSNWSDNYVDTRTLAIPGSAFADFVDTTDTLYEESYNKDVTLLDPRGILFDPVKIHEWPILYYRSTIDNPDALDGFALSMEKYYPFRMEWFNKVSNYPVGNAQNIVFTESYSDSTEFTSTDIISSDTGQVSLTTPTTLLLVQGSPVSAQINIELFEKTSLLKFDYQFLSGSAGILSVYFDEIKIVQIDQNSVQSEPSTTKSIFVGNADAGLHKLVLRLDSFEGEKSSVEVSSLKFGSVVVTLTPEAIDDDQDGFTENQGDCNDIDSAINPNATELCDGIDNNCNGQIDEGFDQDGDGYTACSGDPDDGDSQINPATYADLSTSLTLVKGRLGYDRLNRESILPVTLSNQTTSTYVSPFVVIVTSISDANVTVANPDGYTAGGLPYFIYSDVSELSGSSTTSFKTWRFANPLVKRFTFTTEVTGYDPSLAE
jgi:ASPIC and UnbV/FG-GAP-like repeat/Putative metal-binding motif/PKD domain